MTTSDFRALCAELLDHYDLERRARERIKEALAHPAPEVVGPSAEEVEELCEEHCFNVEGYESIECLQGLINEAIARWGRPALSHPAPVPVSKRPWEREGWCDGSNRCWWGRAADEF